MSLACFLNNVSHLQQRQSSDRAAMLMTLGEKGNASFSYKAL